jgi:hypothetical protein
MFTLQVAILFNVYDDGRLTEHWHWPTEPKQIANTRQMNDFFALTVDFVL